MRMMYAMGWLRVVGSLRLYVSFAKEPYKSDLYSPKRHIILRSLLLVATPYIFLCTTINVVCTCPPTHLTDNTPKKYLHTYMLTYIYTIYRTWYDIFSYMCTHSHTQSYRHSHTHTQPHKRTRTHAQKSQTHPRASNEQAITYKHTFPKTTCRKSCTTDLET